jgi:hypothetical protein
MIYKCEICDEYFTSEQDYMIQIRKDWVVGQYA